MTEDLIHVLNSYAITPIDRSEFTVTRIHDIYIFKKNENNNAIQRIYIYIYMTKLKYSSSIDSPFKILLHKYLFKNTL